MWQVTHMLKSHILCVLFLIQEIFVNFTEKLCYSNHVGNVRNVSDVDKITVKITQKLRLVQDKIFFFKSLHIFCVILTQII
jgi:hypothetical protein